MECFLVWFNCFFLWVSLRFGRIWWVCWLLKIELLFWKIWLSVKNLLMKVDGLVILLNWCYNCIFLGWMKFLIWILIVKLVFCSLLKLLVKMWWKYMLIVWLILKVVSFLIFGFLVGILRINGILWICFMLFLCLEMLVFMLDFLLILIYLLFF